MEENVNKKTQGVALGLVLVAAVVAVGGYMYLSGNTLIGGKSDAQQQQVQQVCPIDQVGEKLNITLVRQRATAADGAAAAQIETVASGGKGETSGLRVGDIIVEAQGTRTTCPKDVNMQLEQGWGSGEVTLLIERNGEPMEIKIKTETAAESTES